jgi:hypothetical protein
MTTGTIISLIGFSAILLYILVQILNFYGIGTNVYGTYLAFYLFILLSLLILPNNIPDSLISKSRS